MAPTNRCTSAVPSHPSCVKLNNQENIVLDTYENVTMIPKNKMRNKVMKEQQDE